ncbi:MAG: family 78 glycoside hydrolase catalytic domain [Bacteroidota bacterium]
MTKILRFAFIITILLIGQYHISAQSVINLMTENQPNPIGLTVKQPKFSWQVKPVTKNTKQTAYQLIIASSEANLKKNIGDVWDSKKVNSTQSVSNNFSGKELGAGKKYFWKVKIWNEKAKPSAWSMPSFFEMGNFEKLIWIANWIGKIDPEKKGIKALDFQKEFKLNKRATKIKVYASGLGAYYLIINGKKVGNNVLATAMSKYSDTLFYQTYELDPELISPGTNFISASVGNGFWGSGHLGLPSSIMSDGPNRLLFQMELSFYDGSVQTVASDASWQVKNSATVASSIYAGETYDGQLEYSKDWKNADILDEANSTITFYETGSVKGKEKSLNFSTKNKILVASSKNATQIAEEIKAVKVNSPKKNQHVFDFGKTITGFVQLSVEGKADKEVEITFSETLDKKGFVDQSAMKIKPKDVYILKGYSTEIWEPKFTYHKFRYAQISGYSGKVDINSLIAKVIANISQ